MAAEAWGEDENWTINENMLTKIEDLVNHPMSYSFANLEITTRAKVAQQESGAPEEDLALSSKSMKILSSKANCLFIVSWSTVRPTLNVVNGIDAMDLDSPTDGLGKKYKMNLNNGIWWRANFGPIAKEETLPSDAKRVLHDRVTRTDVTTFFDDWTGELLGLEIKETLPYFQRLR